MHIGIYVKDSAFYINNFHADALNLTQMINFLGDWL